MNILLLYRGRNYDPKKRPVVPVMLWKPLAPIYPKLVKNIAEGLSFEETKEMRNRGLNSNALMKLSKRWFYMNCIDTVRGIHCLVPGLFSPPELPYDLHSKQFSPCLLKVTQNLVIVIA